MQTSRSILPVNVGVKAFRLAKYDGEHVPGDGKVPEEFVVGGDGLETKIIRPNDPEFAATLADERAGEDKE